MQTISLKWKKPVPWFFHQSINLYLQAKLYVPNKASLRRPAKNAKKTNLRVQHTEFSSAEAILQASSNSFQLQTTSLGQPCV